MRRSRATDWPPLRVFRRDGRLGVILHRFEHLFHVGEAELFVSRPEIFAKSVQLLGGNPILLDRVVSSGKIGVHVANEISRDCRG